MENKHRRGGKVTYSPEEDALLEKLYKDGLSGRELEEEFERAGFKVRSQHALWGRYARIREKERAYDKKNASTSLTLRSFKPKYEPNKFDYALAREIRGMIGGNRAHKALR